jgi:hypothetical protein
MGTSRSLRVLTKGRFSTKRDEIQENLYFSCLIFRRGVCKSRAQHTSKMKMNRLQPGTSNRGRLVQPPAGQLAEDRAKKLSKRATADVKVGQDSCADCSTPKKFGSVKKKKKKTLD